MQAVRVLVTHYESFGERVLRMLAEAKRLPGVERLAADGRALHVAWCVRTFAPALAGRSGAARKRRLAQIVAVCDVHMWKLLRLDAGLGRRQVELALVELLDPLMNPRTAP